MGDVAVERVRGAALAYTVVAGPSRDAAWFVWGHGLTSSMAREDEFGLVDPAAVARVTNVLRYDARGHGSSDSTADLDAYHWRQLAEDQLALTSALGIDRYVAGGASMGCATALYAALAAPDRIAGLVLAIPPTAWETRAAQRDAYELTAALVAAGNVEVVIEGARALPPPDPLVDVAAWRDGTERTLRVTDPSRLERIFAGAAAANLPSRGLLATIDLPALILAWTGDAGHPVSTARELAAVLPEARLVTATTLDDLATWTERVVEFERRRIGRTVQGADWRGRAELPGPGDGTTEMEGAGMGEHEGHASSDPMKQAWSEVAESISALGRQMKGRYRDHAAATDTSGAGVEEDPTAEDTEAERAADEKTAALRAAFEQFVAAGKQVGERVTDVAKDDAVKAQAKQTATSLDGALSATVDLITEQIEGLIGRAKGGRGASTPPEPESTEPASPESPTWDPPAADEPIVAPPDGTTPS